jgi:hypothetical protein
MISRYGKIEAVQLFFATHAVVSQFMEFANDSTKKHGAYANETFLPFIPPEVKFLKRQEKKGTNHEILVRVVSLGSDSFYIA